MESWTDEDGDNDVHGTGSGGAHGMQGDGVGIGDIGDVQGGSWGAGVEATGACPVVLTDTLTCRYTA